MTRLPQVGGDSGNWGSILNDYLSVTHNADGTLKGSAVAAAGVEPAGLSDSTKTQLNDTIVAVGDNNFAPRTRTHNTPVGQGELMLSAKDFGAIGDGATDDTAAVQAAINYAIQHSALLIFPPGIYKITSAIEMGGSINHLNWHLWGYGAMLKQFSDNTPIFHFSFDQLYQWTIRGFDLEWANPQPVTNSLAIAFYFDSSGTTNSGFYNFVVEDLRISNAYRGFCINEAAPNTIPVWGIIIRNIHFTSSCTGSCIRLVQTASGQPNIHIEKIYMRMDVATEVGIVIQGADNVLLQNIEANKSNVTAVQVTTCDGVVMTGIRDEMGTPTVNQQASIVVSDSRATITGVMVQTKTLNIPSAGWFFAVRGIGANTEYSLDNVTVASITQTLGSMAVAAGDNVAGIALGGTFRVGSIPRYYRYDNTASHIWAARGVFGAVVQLTTNTTLGEQGDIFMCNGTNLQLTLPSSAATLGIANRQYRIKNLNSTPVTVVGTVDATVNPTIAQYEAITLVSGNAVTGGGWFQI